MLGLLFGRSKKRNVDKAPQDVAAAPAGLDPQEEDPEYEPEGKKTRKPIFKWKMSHKRWKQRKSCQKQQEQV
eukprot:11918519-Ditylum_brightwellii.AAC.1